MGDGASLLDNGVIPDIGIGDGAGRVNGDVSTDDGGANGGRGVDVGLGADEGVGSDGARSKRETGEGRGKDVSSRPKR